MFTVKNAGRLLLLGPDKNGLWGFPSEEFDGALNGGLDDTVRRSLTKIMGGSGCVKSEARCVSTFVARNGEALEAVYVFSIETHDDCVTKCHMWARPDELNELEIDFRTAALMKVGVVK